MRSTKRLEQQGRKRELGYGRGENVKHSITDKNSYTVTAPFTSVQLYYASTGFAAAVVVAVIS